MCRRAVSDVVGYVLIFSLVSVTVGVVSVAGFGALEDTRAIEQSNNAERAFDVLADNVADLYREGAPSRATEITLDGASIGTGSTATINVSGWDGAGTNFSVERESDVLRWEGDDRPTTLTYAFGTVVRGQRDGGVVVRDGPFQFESDRTILQVVQTRVDTVRSYAGGTVRVRGIRSVPTLGYRGDGTVFTDLYVNVTTGNPSIWHTYLDRQEGTTCTVGSAPEPGKRTVRCALDPREELYVSVHPVNVAIER